MIEAAAQGFGLLSFQILAWALVGVLVTNVICVIPGLGGVFSLVILLPFALELPPEAALAMLVASVAVSGSANTITSVLFGVPGSATGVATLFDGYPMAQKGEGARAVAAGLGASSAGGILGAVVLALMLPFVRPIVLALGSAEFATLILLALIMTASISSGDRVKGLIAGLLGFMLSMVGLEPSTATQRWTFGELYLWEGIQLVPVMIGLFAISEMLLLLGSGKAIAKSTASVKGQRGQVWQGLRDVLVHWRTTVQSSVVGVIVGLAPGIGGESSQFIAYAQAARTSKRSAEFGTGIVEGVIASDAATNSKDGSSLIPTLAFGIPGSASMAILLAAMIGIGLQPGPGMLTGRNLSIVWLLVYILVFGAIAGTLFSLPFVGLMARLTFIRGSVLAPIIIVVSLFGAYTSSQNVGDIVTAVSFGLLGFAMQKFDYSRTSLIIGFVLGGLFERHFLLAMRLFGWSALSRPIVIGLLIFGLALLVLPVLKKRRG